MIIPIQKRNGGIAMIIVMVMILVFSVLAGGFAYSMRIEMRLARQANYDTDFEWLGRSGVERARLEISELFKNRAQNPATMLKQRWAGGSDTNVLPDLPFQDIKLGEGTIKRIDMVDAEQKFNINRANRALMQQVLNQAMKYMGVDPSESAAIVDSIIDWTDTDNDEGISGTESSFYLAQDPPYAAKNGPIDDMTELLFIRGIRENPAIFWGSKSTNYQPGVFMNRDQAGIRDRELIEYEYGLNDFFTAISPGKVNINTAPRHVIEMLVGNPDAVTAIMTERAGVDGVEGTEDDRPVRVGQISSLSNNAIAQEFANAVFTEQSQVFEVTVTCEIGGFERQYIAIINCMNQRDINVIHMYWKRGTRTGTEAEGGDASEGMNVSQR